MNMMTSVINTQIHKRENALNRFGMSDGRSRPHFHAVRCRKGSSGEILGSARSGVFVRSDKIPRHKEKNPAPATARRKNWKMSASASSPNSTSGSEILERPVSQEVPNPSMIIATPSRQNRKGSISPRPLDSI